MKIWLLLFALLALPARAEEDPARELNRDLEGLQRNIEQARRVIEERVGAIDRAKIDQARRKVMVLANDQQFLKAAGDLWHSPERNTLLIAQLLFAVFMYFFKAWRVSKAGNWFTKLLTGFVLAILTWIGIVLVLPSIILGEPFRQVVSTLWRVLTA